MTESKPDPLEIDEVLDSGEPDDADDKLDLSDSPFKDPDGHEIGEAEDDSPDVETREDS